MLGKFLVFIFVGILTAFSFSYGEDDYYYAGSLEGETGVKLSALFINYTDIEGSRKSIKITDFLSMYGYIGSRINPTLSVGASVEMGAGAYMSEGYGYFYNPFEINALINLKPARNLRFYAGAGMSFNNLKESSINRTKPRLALGVQFSIGGKVNISPALGILAEYKGRMFFGEDTVIHGLAIGVYLLAR